MKNAEYNEGQQAWDRFTRAMEQALAVPHDTIQKRIEEHREQAAKNPRKRGPKRKNL